MFDNLEDLEKRNFDKDDEHKNNYQMVNSSKTK